VTQDRSLEIDDTPPKFQKHSQVVTALEVVFDVLLKLFPPQSQGDQHSHGLSHFQI